MAIRHSLVGLALFSAACSVVDSRSRRRSDAEEARQPAHDGGLGAKDGSDDRTPGLLKTATGYRLRTESYAVNPGEERYVCYTVPVPEDIVIGAIHSPDNAQIHHFLLVEPEVPEQEGSRECEVILELTWAPIYAATHAYSTLEMPPGTARIVRRGSQLLLQVHLSNTSDEVAFPAATVDIETSKLRDPTPVGITLFGSTIIHVGAGERKVVTNDCRTEEDLRLYAVLPHMHQTGIRLDLATAAPGGEFASFYTRDPFLFGDQHFDPIDRTLPAGSSVRISCTYDNRSGREVDFGERSDDEMCFAIGFTIGGPSFQFCSANEPERGQSVPRDGDAGACRPAENGIGGPCTLHGGECMDKLFCTADFFHADEGICFSIGCRADGDCGRGNTCCTLPVLGDIANLCVPEACRPEYCVPTSMVEGSTAPPTNLPL